MVKKRIVIPKRYIKIARQKKTRAIQNPSTGRMMGRVVVRKKDDRTRVRYLTKTKDWDKSGRIESDEVAGALLGRTKKPVRVRASSKKRGTIRRF